VRSWLALAAAVAVSAAAPAPAQVKSQGPGKAPRRGSVQVVAVHRVWPPLVTVRVAVSGGALLDPPGQEGLAWLGWSAALRGAGDRGRQALQEAFDALGADVDFELDKVQATIVAEVAADQVPALLPLLADLVLRPRFDPGEVEAARQMQIAELQHLRDDDEALAHEAMGRYLYRGTRLGRPTLGTVESLATVRPDALAAWHKRALAQGPLRIGFSGPVAEAQAKAWVQQYFADAPATSDPKPVPPLTAERAGRRLLIVDQPRRTQAQVLLALPVAAPGHKDVPALTVANIALGGTFTSRLVHDLRELRGWAYQVGSALRAAPGAQALQIGFAVDTQQAAPALDLAVRILEELQQQGLTAAELRFAKEHLRGAQKIALEPGDRELADRLRALALGLGVDEVDAFGQRIASVDGKAVRKALADHVQPAHLVAVVVGPARLLRDRIAAGKAQFVVEVLPADGAPEKTTGKGQAVETLPPIEPEVPPPDDEADEAQEPAEGAAPDIAPP
jgi:zinc protease